MNRWAVSSKVCPDPPALMGLVPDASLIMLPLADTPFRASVVTCELGDLSVLIGWSTPLLAFGHAASDRVHLLLPLGEEPERMIVQGRRAGPNDIALCLPGGYLTCAVQRECEWAMVMVPPETARDLLLSGRRAHRLRQDLHGVLQADPASWGGAASLLRSVPKVHGGDPAIFDGIETCRGLRDSLLEALRDLLTGSPGIKPARLLRSFPLRQAMIRRSEAWIAAHPELATDVAAIGDGSGIPLPRLRAAYRASFGIDVAEFARLRRTSLHRATLHAGADGA